MLTRHTPALLLASALSVQSAWAGDPALASDVTAPAVLLLPLLGAGDTELEQAAALLSQSLEARVRDLALEQALDLSTLGGLGRVVGVPAEEHLARCNDACQPLCQRRLGRLLGLDWVVGGAVRDGGPTSRHVELWLIDLHAPLSGPRVQTFEIRTTGHHSAIVASEGAMMDAIEQTLRTLPEAGSTTSLCADPASGVEDLAFFVAPFEVTPGERDAGQGVELAARLEQAFDEALRLDARRRETHALGTVAETASSVFLESCPPGDHYQCALHAAENTGVGWAVTGVVDEGPAELGARTVQVYFVDRANPQVGDAEVGLEAVLAVGDPDAERRFFAQVVAAFEAFVRSGVCAGSCDTDPALRISAWSPQQAPDAVPDEPRQTGRSVIEDLDGTEETGGLDALEGSDDEAAGFTVAGRGGDLVVEGGVCLGYAATGTALYADVVLDTYQSDQALALGSYLVAEQRPSAAVTLGFGVGLTERLDVTLRGGVFSGAYRQVLSTREWDSWDEVVVWDDVDERDTSEGFLAWHALASLHWSLRPGAAPEVAPATSGEDDVDLERGGRDLGGSNRGGGVAAVSASERLEELDLDDEAGADPTLPPVALREVRTDRRLAPFLELGGGVWQLPLPAAHQDQLPSAVQTWDGFTWPTARLAVGLDYGLTSRLDVALMAPLVLHLGPATRAMEQGELGLLTFLEERPSLAWGTGLEVLVRPRIARGR